VVLVLFGALAGAAVGGAGAASEQRRRDAARVSLFVTVADLSSAEVSNGRVSIEGGVAVANGGPVPVEVSGPQDGDFLVWGKQLVAAAAAARFAVSVRVECADGVEKLPLPV
jgi:hypothetical protein